MTATKTCTKCRAPKVLGDFYTSKTGKLGLRSQCKVCVNADNSAYVEANREKIRKYNRAYYLQHGELIRSRYLRWYYGNTGRVKVRHAERREELREYMRVWSKTPRGKASFQNARHKRRAKMQASDITAEYLETLLAETNDCPKCETAFTYDDPHAKSYPNLDHIVPLGVGGTHTVDNVRYLCRDCNLRRPKNGSDNNNKKEPECEV